MSHRETLESMATRRERLADSTVHPLSKTKLWRKQATAIREVLEENEQLRRAAIKVCCCFAGVGQACPIHEKR